MKKYVKNVKEYEELCKIMKKYPQFWKNSEIPPPSLCIETLGLGNIPSFTPK